MARHQEDEPTFGRTALMAAGIAAGVLAAVIVAVLIVGTSSSAPAANPPPLGLDGTAAAKTSAASSSSPGRSSTSARASSSAHPSTSASPQPSRTSGQAPRPARTSSVAPAPAPTTRRRTSSSSRAPAPAPTPTSHLTFTIPGHTFTGKIAISMPKDWTITGFKGGQRDGNTWSVAGGQLSVTVAGPSGSNETMTATMYPLGLDLGTTTQSYQLN